MPTTHKSESLTVTANPSTDLWRKPPSTNSNNAPTQTLTKPTALKNFLRARITVSAHWTARYDQGGLALLITHPHHESKWLKTGVEFYRGKPNVSTVGTDAYSDWSIFPSPPGLEKWTVEVRREGDENGKGIWVYLLNGEDEVPLREVAWVFADEEDESWAVEVAAYAARPAKKGDEGIEEGKEGLVVNFENAEVVLK